MSGTCRNFIILSSTFASILGEKEKEMRNLQPFRRHCAQAVSFAYSAHISFEPVVIHDSLSHGASRKSCTLHSL